MPAALRFTPIIALLLVACGEEHRSQPPDACDELCAARASACAIKASDCKAACVVLTATDVTCLKALSDCSDAAWDQCVGGGSGCTPEHPCGGGWCTPSTSCDGNQVVKVTCDGILSTTKTTPCATGQTCLDGQCVVAQP